MQEILAGSRTKMLLASIRDTEAVVAMARLTPSRAGPCPAG
jgi:hypothetical protein